MKKILAIALFLCLLGILAAGCKNNSSRHDGNNAETSQKSTPHIDVTHIDVDLTALSSIMVYAEVFNMMANPNDYIGKTIKLSGRYYTSFYDETGKYYHYIVIEDAAACCQQGLEFVWNGEHDYPDDYPEEQTEIEVVGMFGRYKEFGEIYYCLAVDEIAFVESK